MKNQTKQPKSKTVTVCQENVYVTQKGKIKKNTGLTENAKILLENK